MKMRAGAQRELARLGMIVILAIASHLASAQTSKLITGMNVVNPMRSSVADQDALIAQLKAANVHVIRAWFSADDKGIDFAKRVYAQGIKIELGLDFQYPPDAPKRAYQPQEFPNMWGGHPLSYADPTFEVGRNRRRLRRRGAIALSVAVGTEAGWRRSRAGAIAAWWSSLDLCRQASVGR